MNRRAYTVSAIADELGKSASWVEQEIRDNRLPTKRAGRTRVILADVYQAYLERLPDADDTE